MTVANSKEKFFKENPQYSKHKKDYILITKEFQKVLYRELFKGKTIETPIGNLEVITFKPARQFKKRPIDFKATKEEGFTVRHMNEHTEGLACKINFTLIKKLARYKFRPVRQLARSLAKYIFDNPQAYKQYNEISKYKHSNISSGVNGNNASPSGRLL